VTSIVLGYIEYLSGSLSFVKKIVHFN